MTREQQIELCKIYNNSDIDCFQYLRPFCNKEQSELLERLISLNTETTLGWGERPYTSEESNEYTEGKWKLLTSFGLEDRNGDATFEGIAYGTI